MDASIVERARAGDREAFATLARHALPWMDGVARLTLRDPELARDAVQEALVRAWKSLPGLRDPEQFQAWLRRLVIRACIDELRRTRGRHRVEVALTDLHHPEILDSSLSSADRDALERAFRRLDPVQRSAVALFYYLDLSVAEVAAALELPEGTVKSTLSRSRAALRAALEADARPGAALEGGVA
ncbi:MAG TPA: RNA polymerase sigma factor [Candidatus Limnocylindrales bacterium]|jgi:RNA polymerase sigma-70 factor (ECF subfamily)|nr:RNA polymerase sigma factor [Candidatus Limnocylindrales bacterium]